MKGDKKSDLRSSFARARGLGSAKSGVGHWWLQRLTAVALIPLSLYVISSIISVIVSPDVITAAKWFSYPVNSWVFILLCLTMFLHAKLGLQVVIEDYIKCNCTKYSLLIANSFFCFAGAAVCVIAVLKLHFLNIAGI